MNAKDWHLLGLDHFQKRGTLMSLWQEIADNFYPQRADFTLTRTIGIDYAASLMTSYPINVHRDLTNQITTMLRPSGKQWAHMGLYDGERENNDNRRWMQWVDETMRRAMYARPSRFTRATKEGDADFSGFGQAVITVEMNPNMSDLLYRCWHLRDCAWMEDETGEICAIWRKWKPHGFELKNDKRLKHHDSLDKLTTEGLMQRVDCMHMMIRADLYDGPKRTGFKWQEVYYDSEHNFEMLCQPSRRRKYVIPRWQTVSGSQYAFSPATIAGLPEARLIQAMTLTLLEAGEKLANPPMIATHEAVRSDVQIFAGGLTWIDAEYDERFGEALRPLQLDGKGMPLGVDMQRDARLMLMDAFYLSKLNLPTRRPEMTAYEVGQYVAQYIRDALPIFEPMEIEYNGGLCEETFHVMRDNGAFGHPNTWPKELRDDNVIFRFESPLHDVIEQQKGQKLLEGLTIAKAVQEIDPTSLAILKAPEALRDALNGIGWAAKWQNSPEEAQALVEAQRQNAQQAQAVEALTGGAEAADLLAGAQQKQAQAAATQAAIPA